MKHHLFHFTAASVIMLLGACSTPSFDGCWRDVQKIELNSDGQKLDGVEEYVFRAQSPKSGDVVHKVHGSLMLDGIGTYDYQAERYGTYVLGRKALDITYYPDSILVKTAFHPKSFLMGLIVGDSTEELDAAFKDMLQDSDEEEGLLEQWTDFNVGADCISFSSVEGSRKLIKTDSE